MNTYPPEYDDLLAHLLSFTPMPTEFRSLLFPELKGPFDYTEHSPVLKPDETAQTAYWPISGYLRRYTTYKPEADREYEEEKTTDISVPGKIYLPSHSFMNQVPVDFSLETRKGSRMITFSYDSFITMAEKMPEVYQLANLILGDAEQHWLKKIEICKVNSKEAYEGFKKFFSDPVGKGFLLQKQVASYIGISEEELSRIINGHRS
ncbi:hypothetical protein [Pedobacter frigoris]|uniref:Crp/Fnr family transcriptional regulator n=1 Tax=Pedobacter frigoris TaxID=2571272 RepID=UPI00292ECFE3|nr:hypothetical protein [Pedobacter frigoris]